jgi:hypothetical protein
MIARRIAAVPEGGKPSAGWLSQVGNAPLGDLIRLSARSGANFIGNAHGYRTVTGAVGRTAAAPPNPDEHG